MSSNALFTIASSPIIKSFKVELFLPLKTFEMPASSARIIGRPTIDGKTEVGKFDLANPAFTNLKYNNENEIK